jgi:hypothetical protein
MKKDAAEFDTKKEASAFIKGVEYVNDSALEVVGLRVHNGKWIVEVTDEDGL